MAEQRMEADADEAAAAHAAAVAAPAPAVGQEDTDDPPLRRALLHLLEVLPHEDPHLFTPLRAFSPLSMPPPPAASNAGAAAAAGAGSSPAWSSAAAAAGAQSLPHHHHSRPDLSIAAVHAAAAIASAVGATAAGVSAPPHLHPIAAAATPLSGPSTASASASSVASLTSPRSASSSPSTPGVANQNKDDFISMMLAEWPFNALGDVSYREGPLRSHLADLPLPHLFLLAFHFGLFGEYTLAELRDTRKRGVATAKRRHLGFHELDTKNHALRKCVHATKVIRAELIKRNVSAEQVGPEMKQEDMGQLGPALQKLVGCSLLPCTLLANFHTIIKKSPQPPSPAVAYLQDVLGSHVAAEINKWSLLFLFEVGVTLKVPLDPPIDIGELCHLLHKEGVHVPAKPRENFKDFFVQLLLVNMRVEYEELMSFERWLVQQGVPAHRMPFLRATQAHIGGGNGASSGMAAAAVAPTYPMWPGAPAGAAHPLPATRSLQAITLQHVCSPYTHAAAAALSAAGTSAGVPLVTPPHFHFASAAAAGGMSAPHAGAAVTAPMPFRFDSARLLMSPQVQPALGELSLPSHSPAPAVAGLGDDDGDVDSHLSARRSSLSSSLSAESAQLEEDADEQMHQFSNQLP